MPTAGLHRFAVPDRVSARALAEALSAFGFPTVTARPGPHADRTDGHPDAGRWRVEAVDEGHYPPGQGGYRTYRAARRAAVAIARAHGGLVAGGREGSADAPPVPRPGAPVVLRRPGARPDVPPVRLAAPPADAALPLDGASAPAGGASVPADGRAPDGARAGEAVPGGASAPAGGAVTGAADVVGVDLAELADTGWSELTHAHGPADDVPALVAALADGSADWRTTLDTLIGDDVLHQGRCFSATVPTLRWLARLVRDGGLTAAQRLDLHRDLLFGAGRRLDSLLADANRAAVARRPPVAAPYADEVHAAVGDLLPGLLARWSAEPPAVRLVLAALAGLYPRHAAAVRAGLAGMRAGYAGTRPGAYLELAAALADGDDRRSLALAEGIVAWHVDLDPDGLAAPGVPAAIRAGSVLVEAVLGAGAE